LPGRARGATAGDAAGGAEKAAAVDRGSAPAPASDQVGASSAPAQGEAAAVEPQADGRREGRAPTVKKSLYTVSSLADLLSTIRYIAMDAESEKEWEQDDSPIPARCAPGSARAPRSSSR
jgi:hypothetical protein